MFEPIQSQGKTLESLTVERGADWHSWKSLFGAAHQIEAGYINDVTERESDIIKAYCKRKAGVNLTD